MTPMSTIAELDGIVVTLYRTEDGLFVVDIDTSFGEERDHHLDSTPRLRLRINESDEDLGPSGEWQEVTRG